MPLNPLNHHYAIENPASVYDEEAMTALELAGRTTAKVNETVRAFNELVSQTKERLDNQDETIATRMDNQDETIATRMGNQDNRLTQMETKQIPSEVATEVQRNINSGAFDHSIDVYAGNLSERVDALLGRVKEGSTTGDAELIDSRTSSSGKVYTTAGEHLRDVSNKSVIDLTFEQHRGMFIGTTGAHTVSEGFNLSDPITVIPGEKFIFETVLGNQYIAQVAFSTGITFNSYSIVGTVVIGPGEQGRHIITVPEQAKLMYISTQVDCAVPHLWSIDKSYRDAINPVITAEPMLPGGETVNLEFDQFDHWYMNIGSKWVYNEDLPFGVSNPVPVTPGEIYTVTFNTANRYVMSVIFQNSDTTTNDNLIRSHLIEGRGFESFVVPVGATHMFVANGITDTYVDKGRPLVQKISTNIFDEVVPLFVQKNNRVNISLPDTFELVVGDTFELFYKGIIQAKDPYIYDIAITCDMGKAMERKYTVTPTSANIGEHTFKVIVRDNTGNVLGEANTKLVVKNKASSPAAVKNILCVGDSLTAGGQWVGEVKRRLTGSGGTPAADGLTRVSFIGKKSGNGGQYEATGGWSIENYIKSDAANPFYNAESGKVDFADYVMDCGVSNLDLCIVLLGWNSSKVAEETYKNQVRTFINNLRTDYSNVKIMLFGIQVPDINGLGENYGCGWNYMDKVRYVFNLNQWLADVAGEYEGVSFVNVAAQFDTDNNMPQTSAQVNIRNTTLEIVGNNGVHPATVGYYQIADVAYRAITHYLQEV